MSNPTVCAVMLVNGRAPMVARAICSFREQTYQGARLCIFDSGDTPVLPESMDEKIGIIHASPESKVLTIGLLRNLVLRNVFPDIVIHWDSDDWSHPRRIEEQVALLQASGKECVGYRNMLFWQAAAHQDDTDAAWLYTGGPNFCLGTSLAYWRSVWEKRPFEDLPKHATGGGEDTQWLRRVDHQGLPSTYWLFPIDKPAEPRMIASIHGGNTSSMVSLAIKVGDSMIKRVPVWDSYCRSHMELK